MQKEEAYVYREEHWSAEDPKETVVKHIEKGSSVLDVGCGMGQLGAWLKKNLNCAVDGIEFHPEAVAKAKKRLDAAYQLNLDEYDKIDKIVTKNYDYITMIDVLEHCMYPEEVLRAFKKSLSPGGKFIISLPNVAHHSVRFALLRGRFDYKDSGILDKTHLHFYTKKTMAELLQKAGLKATLLGDTTPKHGFWHWVGQLDPTLSAVQFIFLAE